MIRFANGWGINAKTITVWDDGVFIGEYRIRHYLTDDLKVGAGHIGYSIKKEFRGRGYGTKGLSLTLDLAREIVPESKKA